MIHTLESALEKRGYTSLTQVQEAVSAPELAARDLLVSAQTGSGKTVGFGLAIAPTILNADGHFERAGRPLALIVAPTRELALQVKRELAWLFAGAGAVVASTVGGMNMSEERRNLERGAHIVVATPGRLRDHIERRSLDMSAIKAVVLDEADEMLDLGFREDLEFILEQAPSERRTLMFSATVPRAISNLARSYQRDAVRVTTVSETSQHADIEYQAVVVAERDAENAIINVLRYYESPNAIVFGNTRAMVTRLTTRLSNRGFSVVALSGELSQSERTHALQAMRDGRARVCIATDVAARGIDLPNLDLVVHADLPQNSDTLLHRSGRTGRAGRKGVSVLIAGPKSRRKAERLLQGAKVMALWTEAPSADMVLVRDRERLLADPTWTQAISEEEVPAIAALTSRYSAEQIAAAFLRLSAARQSAPEELAAIAEPTQRAATRPIVDFGASVWFSLPYGHDAGAEPRRLMPMLCKMGNLTKDDIGAIRIREHESFIEISAASVARFSEALGEGLKVEKGFALTRLAQPPELERGNARPRHTPGPREENKARPRYEKPIDKKPVDRKLLDKKTWSEPSSPSSRPDSADPEIKPRKARWDSASKAEAKVKRASSGDKVDKPFNKNTESAKGGKGVPAKKAEDFFLKRKAGKKKPKA